MQEVNSTVLERAPLAYLPTMTMERHGKLVDPYNLSAALSEKVARHCSAERLGIVARVRRGHPPENTAIDPVLGN